MLREGKNNHNAENDISLGNSRSEFKRTEKMFILKQVFQRKIMCNTYYGLFKLREIKILQEKQDKKLKPFLWKYGRGLFNMSYGFGVYQSNMYKNRSIYFVVMLKPLKLLFLINGVSNMHHIFLHNQKRLV